MKQEVERLNAEYNLDLSAEEIAVITKQVESGRRLLQKLFEVDVEGAPPALQFDPAMKK